MIQSLNIPLLRTNRVDSIRNRLYHDEYSFDIDQITRKLIDLEIALTGAFKIHAA